MRGKGFVKPALAVAAELSLAGQNLLASPEVRLPISAFADPRYFPRSAELKATWQF